MNSPFIKKSFVFLWMAQAGSGLGGTFAAFLMSWLVYDLTGSMLAMSSVWVAFMLPSILTNLISGPYIDKLQYKTVMIVSEWLRAGGFFILGIVVMADRLSFAFVIVIAVLIGFAEPLFRPASMSYVAHILPKQLLQRGNSVLEGTMQLMMLAGPALAGFLLTIAGPEVLIAILVIVLFSSGSVLLFVPKVDRKSTNHPPSWFFMFKEGLSFYRLFPVLLWIGLLMTVINFSTGAAVPLFLPYIIDHIGGTEFMFGLFTSLFSLGMMAGSLVTGVFKQPANLRVVMLGSLTINGFLMIVLGVVTSIWVALAVSLFQGVFAMIFTINNTTFYQQRVPPHLRGRVFAVRTLLAQSGIPLGAVFGGFVAEGYGFTILFLTLGGFILIATAVAWMVPIFYQLNQPLEEESLPDAKRA
ncbi:MFS transporter [Alteribacter aurantiacus]|uniref:MFS transporter n=1 Tax=Alteribacter aurantiacus TaxID=254410 RepID=UPI00047D3261|nr:MFS transporter [Alteribacter aurantiacus]